MLLDQSSVQALRHHCLTLLFSALRCDAAAATRAILDHFCFFPMFCNVVQRFVSFLAFCCESRPDELRCEAFTSIFDLHGDGVLRHDEFLDFARWSLLVLAGFCAFRPQTGSCPDRFLCIMSYLHSSDGEARSGTCSSPLPCLLYFGLR